MFAGGNVAKPRNPFSVIVLGMLGIMNLVVVEVLSVRKFDWHFFSSFKFVWLESGMFLKQTLYRGKRSNQSVDPGLIFSAVCVPFSEMN